LNRDRTAPPAVGGESTDRPDRPRGIPEYQFPTPLLVALDDREGQARTHHPLAHVRFPAAVVYTYRETFAERVPPPPPRFLAFLSDLAPV